MAELNSSAEHFAESATKLPAFRNLNLGGVKDQVAEILNLIGRIDGIFSTYTKHDISHIDAMLKMLEWLVPPRTREVMTPVDWLLLVLGIYLHDLGMVVTSEEYKERVENEEFVGFLQWLEKDPDAKDYMARAHSMDPEERDRFFYQEFVRLHHAARVREWVTGRHSRFWGDAVKPFSDEINKIMENLPSRFRENLGIICESHHKDNLEKTDVYPLAQRYGNDPSEIANVQYAALLLRTVDLIHVTKDRTPSIMYKAINFSDLKSIDEWDKQIGTFSVHMKSREFDPQDSASHIIEVHADFTEERPFFALTEYLSYADNQIKQTKQWADTSQESADAKNFNFPWRGIRGDVRVEGNLPKQMRFELDRGRLLNLLVGHTIYNEPTVAVRELLQNAIDALRFQFYTDRKSAKGKNIPEPTMGQVLVRWDPKTRELIVQDNGIGMDLNVIENHLLRVGASFYDTPQFQTENSDFTPISRFGIGILTCFMISDNIEIVTSRGGAGRRIRMTSVQADYLIKDLSAGDPQLEGIEPHGTRVRLTLRPSVDLQERSILAIVRQWVLIPVCDVLYEEPGSDGQKVGFANVKEAMEYLLECGREGGDTDDTYEIITVPPQTDDSASYELAFVVQKALYPERSFVSSVEQIRSAVCIEGIRADWRLPGFSRELCAILSVRNNKKFRTTVSRDSLEVDDEYKRVANTCANALFSHVGKEVERIAKLEGDPLLRASTAGTWVYRSLIKHGGLEVRETLRSLYADLPLVVIERLRSDAPVLNGRSLQSLNQIQSLPEFWTIEWRAVDYLGVISRDLGRELNITKFLETVAPDVYDSRFDPIVVEAEAFSDDIAKSHAVVEVDFSRKHQRTVLRWKPAQRLYEWRNGLKGLNYPEVRKFSQTVGLSVLSDARMSHGTSGLPWSIIENIEDVSVAEVTGDVGGMIGVRTRMGTILAVDSQIGVLWERMMSAMANAEAVELTVSERATIFVAMFILAFCATGSRRSSFINPFTYTKPEASDLVGPWRVTELHLRTILVKLHSDTTFSLDLETLVGDHSKWFDASSFWRDWSGRQT